eukprot:6782554-Lingulodinium_polyedra.AAC.1
MATLQHWPTCGALDKQESFETFDACETREALAMLETLAILGQAWSTRNVRRTNSRITRHMWN